MATPSPQKNSFTNIALAIHGGAGVMERSKVTAEEEKEYLHHLECALKAGYSRLEHGGTSLDAVESAVRYLEDCPLFNAGKGAVFTSKGTNELDAAIMDGRTKAAGAVAVVKTVRNPITAARAVMERSEHVLIVAKDAEDFAKAAGLEMVEPSYFFTEKRFQQHKTALIESAKSGTDRPMLEGQLRFGTVGAVALDSQGNLAAATSTGGLTNKNPGRVGDSPLIGAGTYADNKTCAVSATGDGEFFMRCVAAYDIAALIKYKNFTLEAASTNAIERVGKLGGEGGLIALDKEGNCCLPFSSPGMFRGCIERTGAIHVAIYGD